MVYTYSCIFSNEHSLSYKIFCSVLYFFKNAKRLLTDGQAEGHSDSLKQLHCLKMYKISDNNNKNNHNLDFTSVVGRSEVLEC